MMEKVKCLSFHREEPWIFVGLETGDVEIYNYNSNKLIETVVKAHDGACNGIDLSLSKESRPIYEPVPLFFVTGGDDTKVKIWNVYCKCLHTFVGHTASVSSVQFHPRHDWILSTSHDKTLCLWDWKQQTRILVMKGHTLSVMSASFHFTEDVVVSASMDNTLRVWDMNVQVDGTVDNTVEAKYVVTQAHEGGATCVSFHRDFALIVSGGNDKLVKLWNYNEALVDSEIADMEVALEKTLEGHLDNVSSVLFNEKHELIVSASEDKSIRVWDVNDGTILQILPWENDRLWSLALDSERSYIAAGHDSGFFVFQTGSIVFKSEKANREKCVCTVEEIVIIRRAEIRDENPEAENQEANRFDMYDVVKLGKNRLNVGKNRVNAMSFHNKEPWILAGFNSGVIKLFDYEKNTLVQTFRGHKVSVHCIDSHTSIFVSGGSDGKIKVWNYDKRNLLFELVGHDECVRTVKFHHELPWVVSASDDETIRVWSILTKTCIYMYENPNCDACTSAIFHPSDNLVMTTTGNPFNRGTRTAVVPSIAVWDFGPYLSSGTVSSDLAQKYMGYHGEGVICASFHPTESLVVSGGDDHEVRLWRMDETAPVCVGGTKPLTLVNALTGHSGKVSSALFVAEQQIIVSASLDKSIRVWDAHTGALLQIFTGKHRFRNLAVHQEKNLLAAAHDHGMIVFKLKEKDEKVEGDANGKEEVEGQGDANENQEVKEGDGIESSRSGKLLLWEALAQDRD